MAFDGKVLAITGASSGIGRATALMLARGGAKVVLGARREDALRRLAADISSAGGEAAWQATDVTRRKDLQDLVELACTRFGRLDVLISNAGIGPISPIDELRVDDWQAMVEVNLLGVLYGIAAALPVFRRQGAGHFINVISTSGLRIVSPQGIYAGTKNAVRTITEALRQEAGPHLRVSEISPGMVATDFTASIQHPATRAAIGRQVEEIGLAPEAVAGAIAFVVDQPPEVDVNSIVIRPTAQN
jgi:NADP-dependent 3-hydroxy acid dehydrogenase YdfG